MESFFDVALIGMFVAAFLDAFFLTGIFLYGMMFFTTAGTLHMTGKISTFELIAVTYTGSVLANYLNFHIGYFFGKAPIVRRFSQSARAQKARDHLKKRGLFFFMCLGRSIGFIRPVYGIMLGTLHVSRKHFMLYELLIALPWTLFWISVLIFGENVFIKMKEI